MSRTVLLTALLSGCCALALLGGWGSAPVAHALGAGLRPAEPRFTRPWQGARDCKPLAPVALSLQQTGSADGSVVELAFRVDPHADVGPVAWELQLPAGSQLLDGEASGACASDEAGGAVHHARVRLGTAGSLARITLVASAALREAAGAGGGEVVRAIASLSWGDPQAALRDALPGPRLVAVDREGTRRLIEVPSRHRAGR
ncbi:MAG TPA: hypothetical protein VK824_11065 [Planctomycetota bacterium]|nr:hypothetical protein [Planctomycetota bacterium]